MKTNKLSGKRTAPPSTATALGLDTIGNIVSSGCDHRRGGHLVWRHESRRVRPNGGKVVLVHRALFEATNGPIPEGRYLLQACSVPDCIAPDCYRITHYSNWDDVVSHTHIGRCDGKRVQPVCDALSSEGAGCVD